MHQFASMRAAFDGVHAFCVNYGRVHATVHPYCIIIQIDNNQKPSESVRHRNNAIAALSAEYSIGLKLLDLINVELSFAGTNIKSITSKYCVCRFSRPEIDDRSAESIETRSPSHR